MTFSLSSQGLQLLLFWNSSDKGCVPGWSLHYNFRKNSHKKNCPLAVCGSAMQGKGRGWVSLGVFVVVRCFPLPFSSTTVGNFQQFSISMCHRQMRKYSWWGFLLFPSASPLNCNLKCLNLYICSSTFLSQRQDSFTVFYIRSMLCSLLMDTYTPFFPVSLFLFS